MIFERAKFNSHKQLQDETVDDFITDLFCLAEHCAYGELRGEMIRDRLVVRLLDATLSEKIQLDSELTLDYQTEATRLQQPVVRGMSQQDCPTVEHEKIDSLNNSSKNAHKQRPPRSHAGVKPPNRPQTKHRQNCLLFYSHCLS